MLKRDTRSSSLKEVTVKKDKLLANSVTDKNTASPILTTQPKKTWNRELIDMSNEAMLVCDLEYHIISWNQGAERLYGWSAQEAEGQISEVLLKARAPYSDADVQQALLQSGYWEGSIQYTHRDGHYINVTSRRKLMRDKHGRPTTILEIQHAINSPPDTEQGKLPIYYNDAYKRLDLPASEAHFHRLLVDTNGVGLTITHAYNNFLAANDAFLTMLGYTRADLVDDHISWHTLTPEEYHARDQEALQELFATGVCKAYEKEFFNRAGARVPVLMAGACLADSASCSIIALLVDMTAQKEIEQRRETFLNIVGHELRTPLTTMSGTLQLARLRLEQLQHTVSHLSSIDVQTVLTKIDTLLEQSLRQMRIQDRLINDMLDISRLAIDTLELALQPCNLVTLVRETVKDLRFTASKREIQFIEPAQPAVAILADPERVGQVVANYLTNALKYSPPSTPIIVEITLDADMVYVWVHDKGAGLSQDEQLHIWDRYYRVTDAHIHQKSGVNLGLGLYICRVLIERLHGQVGVNSKVGEGSSFWFSLPRFQSTTAIL